MLFVSVLVIVSSSLSVVYGRKFTIVNQCSQTVWYGFLSGFGSAAIGPDNGNYELAPNGGRSVATIPDAGWSGVIAGRTNCTDSGCVTADCGGGKGACTHGFQPPATQAEFTIVQNGVDFYDVEVINGVNLPVSVTPTVSAAANNPYFCGAPGSVTPSAGLGGCSWDLKPPLAEYNWVENGGNACKSDNDCSSSPGTVCGLSFNPGYQQLLQLKCGRLLGYWSADQICGVQRDYGAPFYCNDPLKGQENLINWNLYACVDIGSCYQQDAASTCCGCVNWDEEGLPVPKSPTYTEQCKNRNQVWVDMVKPTLSWLKKACPTAYTYPYDDMSSTFTCNSMSNEGVNTVEYTITFCPK
jgi:hypothetical protein